MDENKTPLTHRATATAAAYLDGLGCKPVETEVPIRLGWIADVASYWYPTMMEAKKLHLHRRAQEILGVTSNTQARDLMPRAYGSGPFTVAVEVKTTRQDFARDDRKWQPGDWPAHICFLAYPTGLIEQAPDGWYGLELSKNGTQVRKVHRGCSWPHPQHSGLLIDFIAAVGIRRDHRTRYAATRAFLKAYRARDRQSRVAYSATRLLESLAAWIRGEGWKPERPLEDVLRDLGVEKLPSYCHDAIAFFEALQGQAMSSSGGRSQ